MELSTFVTSIKEVGFPIAVAAVAIFVLIKLVSKVIDRAEERFDAKEKECAAERERFEKRLDTKEAAHAAERKALTDAHMEVLGELKTQIQQSGQSLGTIGTAIAEIRGSMRRAVGD